MEWRSPTGGGACWQSPRYRPNNRGFGYGQHNENGRFRSPYSRSPNNFHSPRQNFNQRSPRYVGGYSNFNNSAYTPSPISQQQYHSFHRPQQQFRQFSPRGYHNQGGSRRDKNSIENWVHPEMWGDPWAHLLPSSSDEQKEQPTDNVPSTRLAEVAVTGQESSKANSNKSDDEPMSLAENDAGDNNGGPSTMTMPDDNENSQVTVNPNPQPSSSPTDAVQVKESEPTEETSNMPTAS